MNIYSADAGWWNARWSVNVAVGSVDLVEIQV